MQLVGRETVVIIAVVVLQINCFFAYSVAAIAAIYAS